MVEGSEEEDNDVENTWSVILVLMGLRHMKCGMLMRQGGFFDEMMERNLVSRTTMIAGYARNGKSRQALNLFSEMRRSRVELDQVALVAALSACAEPGDLRLGMWIHSYIKNRAFAKTGLWTRGACYFSIDAKLGSRRSKPDEITFIEVLSACSHTGLVDEGRQFFIDMIQNWGIKSRMEHYGCMVDLLSPAGLLDEAHDRIETMPMKPDVAIAEFTKMLSLLLMWLQN
ncbi:hypothetical protein GH714_021577 [Hevea brasiliensis]|uniref:Pentacotripeptide-repeat region of PRORP domain-containing protein n=1 Tax=Hevea brasiliensis TaxID=3981 RepID=A0A6A6MEG6_HEVBR|nr:hypothetical protein GH714_021577 [Hevea brasiliensis]